MTNHLYEARRALRKSLLRKAGASVASWDDVEKELHDIFGI